MGQNGKKSPAQHCSNVLWSAFLCRYQHAVPIYSDERVDATATGWWLKTSPNFDRDSEPKIEAHRSVSVPNTDAIHH